jgi:hypothetical protein
MSQSMDVRIARHQPSSVIPESSHPFVNFSLSYSYCVVAVLSCHSSAHFDNVHSLWQLNSITDISLVLFC